MAPAWAPRIFGEGHRSDAARQPEFFATEVVVLLPVPRHHLFGG